MQREYFYTFVLHQPRGAFVWFAVVSKDYRNQPWIYSSHRPRASPSSNANVKQFMFNLISGGKMDTEAALLVTSPAHSITDSQYPYPLDSQVTSKRVFRNIRDNEMTTKPISRYSLPLRKPKFRIRPPYLIISISIIEVIFLYTIVT